jgi:hypothetical protein
MQEWQQRVIDEKTELDGKIRRLDAFLKTDKAQNLPPGENPRMTRQLAVMREYRDILEERISDFV